ncbi:uncharacterized protein BCR38DRAFT_147500 [Pseudomassariella vexata]|uniref:SET domain-containing protein n=1 Tax=Pseudomassariella vexata TaxID=1141098 RepID=A0A1Y2D5I5_9PEZI|nr:uncharacterized protein BCR38DRAFT_147500 [Pseudomassariella vexata]ORY54543.1 hypothetical protein BCR38DRAFT_147500 [Pseudomassariella vexata]
MASIEFITIPSDDESGDADGSAHHTSPKLPKSQKQHRQSQPSPAQSASQQAPPQQPPRARQPISPPALTRQASTTAPSPMPAGSPSRSSRFSAQKPTTKEETLPAVLPARPGSAVKTVHPVTSPSQLSQQHPIHRTPKHGTPKKMDWSTDKIKERLLKYWLNIGKDGAKLTARQIQMAWKKDASQAEFVSKRNWFTEMKLAPTEGGKETIKIKTKHMAAGRGGKQEKREHYAVIPIKTIGEPVPAYSFHHVEISKNILSPNTMLNFVPHLRDLADEEEPKYRRWLENLENMDKTSGFATLSRQEKVTKTAQKERATILLLYLDSWLDQLEIENCTRSTLIRFMASQTDAVTPQQKSSILNSYSEDSGSPRSAKTIRMFTEAFDWVFNDIDMDKSAVTLRDVLLLDKSVDTIFDSKKWMKDTPSQVKPLEEQMTVESFLETYALLGCLICCSHSCEHGEYGVDNERKRFSVETVGGLEPMLRKQAIQASKNGHIHPSTQKALKPCSDDCYLNGKSNTRARAWNENETMLLRSFAATLSDTNIPVQCATAVATGRPCWDVCRQLDKLDITPPMVSSPAPIKVKPVSWYDRNKKMLLGDWQEQTITHEHQRKDHFDPCNHDGPCTYSNCACVQNRLMCERFCRCTAATCAAKFTGCACHSLGKTCVPKQKERPCICVQLNRECDPALCGSCGASERANPRNADDDALFTTGCQNCALQRGKPKSLVLGKSMIENCGYGLFTTEDIAQDEFVIEYVGELISQDEGVRREARRGDVFDEESNSSYLFTLLEQEGIWVDAAIYGNLSRYINHQDDADKRGLGCNITPKILYVNGEYRIKFSSMRDIKAGEELFFNYGENFPNLTKKLLDEQKEEEDVKKCRTRKKQDDDDDDDDVEFSKVKKAKGAPKGKRRGRKPGRKPKNKAFGKVDSDPEDDDEVANEQVPEEYPFPDIVLKPRKRKRGSNLDSDSEDEEFRPADSDAQSAVMEPPTSRGKVRPRKQPRAVGQTMRKTGSGLFGRNPGKAQSVIQEEDESQHTTPKQRGRKVRKHSEDDAEDDQAVGQAMEVGGAESDSAAEYTPSRARARIHRQMLRDVVESSPLSAPDDAAFAQLQFELIQKDEREEQGRDGGADDSDASSNRIVDRSRSRVRRRPARYSD